MQHPPQPPQGFTLVELAVVLVVIGLLLLMLLRSAGLIPNAQIKDLIAVRTDLQVGMSEFKNRYNYYPGDMPDADTEFPQLGNATFLDATLNHIPCILTAADDPERGDGQITVSTGGDPNIEFRCLPIQLYAAGMIDDPRPIQRVYGDQTILIRVVSVRSADFPILPSTNYTNDNPTVKHVVQYTNLPRTMALEIDDKLDDGNLATGPVRAVNALADPCILLAPLQ